MSVVVLLFGPHARALGRDRAVVVLGDDATCQEVLTALRAQYPGLATLMHGARLAVNSRFGTSATVVNTSDELALIALVAGG
ncbi:MAG: MoaD/ThiS family protein [Phycisphaerae bacterium]|nr:MoaD/ThiS family protein [Phycisphaerae bacterium]